MPCIPPCRSVLADLEHEREAASESDAMATHASRKAEEKAPVSKKSLPPVKRMARRFGVESLTSLVWGTAMLGIKVRRI